MRTPPIPSCFALHPGIECPVFDLTQFWLAGNPPTIALAVVDAIVSTTAQVLPLAGIVAALRHVHCQRVLVDGAHAPGATTVCLRDLDVDFWVGNLHKWMFAPACMGSF